LINALSTGFVSGIIIIGAKPDEKLTLNLKEAFLLIPTCWISVSFFSSLPLMMSGFSLTDSLFEVISSLTTTGATVFPRKLEFTSKGTHLWCAILQWFGGIGIIVMAMSVMPMLRIGGMQLLRMESADRSDKLLPRVSQVAGAIFLTYVFLTIVALLLLRASGMDLFESVCYAMGALSTGGISQWDASIGHYDNLGAEIIMAVFMLIGGTPLFLFVKLWKGDWQILWKDSQSRTYYIIIVFSITLVSFWLWHKRGIEFSTALRHSIFNVISVATSSGYVSTEYATWGGFPVLMLLFLAIVGGCTGSTAGGIKIFRLQVVYSIAKTQIKQILRPHGVFVPTYQNRNVSETVVASVLTYFVLFGLSFVGLTLTLAFTGLTFPTSIYTSLAMLSNLGIAFSDGLNITSNFSFCSEEAKWSMMLGMILGRFEFVTLFALISPAFWKD
jgi:trk system potassium uptake protein TrkH